MTSILARAKKELKPEHIIPEMPADRYSRLLMH